jgi:hypothetical protein
MATTETEKTVESSVTDKNRNKAIIIALVIVVLMVTASIIVRKIFAPPAQIAGTTAVAGASTEPAAQKFALEVGKPILTAWITEGSYYQIHANHEFIALSRLENGGYERIRMPAGWSNWAGRARCSFVPGTIKEGNLACEGVVPGTELTFFGK